MLQSSESQGYTDNSNNPNMNDFANITEDIDKDLPILSEVNDIQSK